MCVRLKRTGCQYFLPARPPQSRPGSVSSSSAAADSTLVGKLFMCALREGWVVVAVGGGTYSRFRSYSCGDTVIISPLLLNSVILSYISRARGQEILQFINRSTLCEGDYCMAYILTPLFSLEDFFFCGFSVCVQWCLAEFFPGSQLQPLGTHVVWPVLCLSVSLSLCFTVPMENRTHRDRVSQQLRYGSLWLESKERWRDGISISEGLTSRGCRGNVVVKLSQTYSSTQPLSFNIINLDQRTAIKKSQWLISF